MGFTKIYDGIVTSTVFQMGNDAFTLWVYMLVTKNKDHVCTATIPSLASTCRLSLEDCERYLQEFQKPDKYSRSQEHDGARIEKREDGFLILNGQKYSEKGMTEARKTYLRDKAREYRQDKKLSTHVDTRRHGVDNLDPIKTKTKTKTKIEETSKHDNSVSVEVHVESAGPTSSQHSLIDEVFTYWKDVMKHPDSRMTPKRKAKIQNRLKDGYSVAQLKQAVDGCARSVFHQGGNPTGKIYDDIELICRDGEHVEQFLNERGNNGPTSRPETTSQRRWRETEELCAALAGDSTDPSITGSTGLAAIGTVRRLKAGEDMGGSITFEDTRR